MSPHYAGTDFSAPATQKTSGDSGEGRRRCTQNWSAKLEYLYTDLGRFSAGPFTPAPASAIAAKYLVAFTDHILRAGINYQLGGPAVAKY